MKKVLFLVAFILTMSSTCLFATGEHDIKPYVGSQEFERLKGLAGSWTGTASEMNGEQVSANVEYSVTSNGSAVVEKLFTGTPHEMISVYRDKSRKLSMTHYCSLGNQPQLDLSSSNENEIKLDFSDSIGIDPAKDPHMHALTLKFEGNDKLVQDWRYYKDGAEGGSTVISLSRAN